MIEVLQILPAEDKSGTVFLRLADDRGWTLLNHPQQGTALFEETHGTIAVDRKTYGFPSSALEPVPILFGPGLESQQTGVFIAEDVHLDQPRSRLISHSLSSVETATGECLDPGQKAEACERYTPDDGSNVCFIKLANGKGWVSSGIYAFMTSRSCTCISVRQRLMSMTHLGHCWTC